MAAPKPRKMRSGTSPEAPRPATMFVSEQPPVWHCRFDVGLFAGAMGTAGLHAVYRKLYLIHGMMVLKVLWYIFGIAAVANLTIAILLHVVKAYFNFGAMRNDLRHIIKGNFIACLPVSMMILSLSAHDIHFYFGLTIWIMGLSLHVLILVYLMGAWVLGFKQAIENLTPASFIPVVAIVVAPLGGILFGWEEVSFIITFIALFNWISVFPLVLYRLGFISRLPPHQFPSLFILCAPPSLVFNALYAIQPRVATPTIVESLGHVHTVINPPPLVLSGLFGIALLMLAVCFRVHFNYGLIGFSLSYYGYIFPTATFAATAVDYHQLVQHRKYGWVALVIYISAISFATSVWIITQCLTFFYLIRYGVPFDVRHWHNRPAPRRDPRKRQPSLADESEMRQSN